MEILRGRPTFIAIVLAILAVLILSRVGHYALWDDEALTALSAKGILRTGDTSALVDHGNIVAYRSALVVRNMAERSTPPLPSYAAALSFAFFGNHAWSARLPFVLCGIGTCALILWWARQGSWTMLGILSLGLLGNVSLMLYDRQSRYYAMAVFSSVAIVAIYWRGRATTANLLAISGLSVLLFASHYLDYLALYACLAVDWFFWRRKAWPPTVRNALLLWGPQLAANAAIFSVWNPLATKIGGLGSSNSILDRLTLFYWMWRDADACEFFALPVLLLALGVGLFRREMWLVRGCLALAIFLAVMTVLTPQPVSMTRVADVRYVMPVIPLAIALEAGLICLLLGRTPWLAIAAAVVVFGTNLLNGGPLLDRGFHSTICDYVGELLNPVPEPYTPASDWINANVAEGESVWVLPDYSTYPLMFHAPRALYAWQLDWPPRADFTALPKINFKGQEPPDYLVAFGPFAGQMAQALQQWNRPDVHYTEVATLPVFWKDLYRPELFWRTFTPVTGYDPNSQAVYIFKRTSPPVVDKAKGSASP